MSVWRNMVLLCGSLIDGKSTVREIIEKLAAHFNDEENYESRVLAYFSQLQKDGFIKLAVSE